MGRFVSAYVVNLEQVRGTIGSGDLELHRLVRQRCQDQFALDAQYFDHDDTVLKLEDAVRGVITGGPYEPECNDRYREAYRLMCHTLSVWSLANGPYHGDWLDEVDGNLSKLGVEAVGFTMFEDNRLPAGLPHLYEGGYGEWTHRECVDALDQFNATNHELLGELDSNTSEWVGFALDIVLQAANSPGRGVAGFFTI